MLNFINVDSYFSDPGTMDAIISTATGPRTIPCHFYNEYESQKMAAEFIFEGSNPHAEFKQSDVALLKQGDPIIIDGTIFKINEKKPADDGIIMIGLSFD